MSPPPKPARRRWIWFVVAPIVAVVVGAALYGLFAGYRVAVRPGDRERVVTIDDLMRHVPGLARPAAAEKLERLWHTDASVEVSYELDASEGTPPLYLTSTVSQSTSSRDAAQEYLAYTAGVKIGAAVSGGGLEETPRDDLLKWGDASRSTVLTSSGQPVGNYFIARKGTRIFTLMVSGVHFDDPAAFRELVQKHLDRMEQSAL